MAAEDDKILNLIADSVAPALDEIDRHDDYAVLVIGAHSVQQDGQGELPQVDSFFAATGFIDIIEDALISELAGQIQEGDMSLFSSLRRVIHTLEEQLDLDPDEDLEEGFSSDMDTPRVLH
jgi:hypothetical protein